MNRERVAPGRFRWRLTIAFVAVSAVSAGVVSLGSYYLVRNDRRTSFEERSVREVHLTETLADAVAGDAVVAPDELAELLTRLRRREAFETVVLLEDGTARSTSRVTPADVPRTLIAGDTEARDSDADPTETEIGGTPYLVVSGSGSIAGVRLYFFFPMTQLLESHARLADILLRLWLIVIVGAALVGSLVARRALRPVARASAAAQALAEGILDTRLPVDTEDEFGAWATSFNQMAEALQDKIDALVEARERERRFTSDVSHELRTPLSALVTSASLLEQELSRLPADLRWSVEQLVGQIRRVRRLLEELMEISRLDAGREGLQIQRTNVDSLARSIIKQRGWNGTVGIATHDVSLETDRRRLERIVSNLVENALEHGAPPFEIRAVSEAEEAVITVSDGGKGLSDPERAHIFDRFYKGDPARAGGSGLGLSIAQENARLLGGRIEVDSSPGRGTTFSIRLPLS